MPTEHEYKYVIDLSFADKFDHDKLRSLSDTFVKIKQAYLAFSKGMTTRVRCQTHINKSQWIFTFKQKVSKRVIEIERKIDQRDGEDLWKVCIAKLKKTRYIFDNEGIIWELDFFKNGNNLYFIQAEVELEEGAKRPKDVLGILKDFVIYEVPLSDDRFANKRLGDVEYATNLYSQVKEKHDDHYKQKKKSKKDL